MSSTPTRFNGTLKKWNVERGFGFVVADHSEQELFVHVSAFPRDGHQPIAGEPLTFAVELDRDGRKRAVQVRRPGATQHPATAPTRRSPDGVRPSRNPTRSGKTVTSSGSSFGTRLVAIVLLCALGGLGYHQYRTYMDARSTPAVPAAQGVLGTQSPGVATTPRPAPAPLFRCDGRQHCSEMTSCQEAKFFLQNCPGTKMDGDGDGIPCEQQLCTGAFGHSR